ncbi:MULTISPECIES: hypothetical protein [unclassified Aeromonas]|uniref:hypothetical protein n=1 Tax=unclassified Aeromonas TaxID=257493 RepID=UPI0022E949D3|nr:MULTISPECIES: hypothetical protein [unclassified Aeromonas]
MKDEIQHFLGLNGIPFHDIPDSDEIYFQRDYQGTWLPVKVDNFYQIDDLCVKLHNSLAEKVFGSNEEYWNFLRGAPELLSTAGMNSECSLSKTDLESVLQRLTPYFPVNKALYLYDCRKLISGIQECSKEVFQLQGEFYQAFNLEELFIPAVVEEDGVRWVTSPIVTKIFALLGFIYIRLHSLLDYSTKLAIEIENLKTDFSRYPRLSSKGKLYSDRRMVSFNGRNGTLFEKCSELNEVEATRNHIVHDGLIDDMPKIYKVVLNGKCIEKYILFPDMTNEGRLDAFSNRNLFYGGEDKINLRLPTLISNIQVRLVKTLQPLLDSISRN